MIKSNIGNFITIGVLSLVLVGMLYHYTDICAAITVAFRL